MMLSVRHGLALVSLAAAVGVPAVMQSPIGENNTWADGEARPAYSENQKEYYLSNEEIGYIRPGLNVEVEDLTINSDNKVEVLLSMTDDMEQPLDRAGQVTPGEISFGFILATYDGESREYSAYTVRDQTSPITNETATQASSDSGGTYEDIEMGLVRYTFGTAMPSGYDPSATHSVALYATRELTDIIGKRYYDNVVYDFRPDGEEVVEAWNAVSDETCNSCHHDLGLHGGRRKAIKLCVTCHNAGVIDPDTGNTVDMKVMIHKIHMGANLPSVQDGMPYQIIGYRQSVHDYSGVLLPQDVRNCQTCHREDSPEGEIWMTRPSRDACGSCHDNINWETGENHAAGPQPNDASCAFCHAPEGAVEFDASVAGAHVIPAKSTQLAGLNMEFLSVEDVYPGGFPTVTFAITEDDGTPVDPSSLDRFSLLVGGPTTDYAEYFRESPEATFDGTVGMYTLTTPIPEDATGTWTFSADYYRFVTIDDGSSDGIEVREAGFNPIHYAELSPAKAVEERRSVVNLDKCNVCHDQLALHGGQRFAIEECVICHNANETDASVRPEEELPAESIHFKWLIHRLHTGHELENDFTVYGYRSSVHNYNHVGYPGDRRYCEACHDSGTYSVPVVEGALPTLTERDYYSPMQPAAAACLSCHSTVDAASHAYVNTAPFGESCAACHGDDRDYSVDKIHAR